MCVLPASTTCAQACLAAGVRGPALRQAHAVLEGGVAGNLPQLLCQLLEACARIGMGPGGGEGRPPWARSAVSVCVCVVSEPSDQPAAQVLRSDLALAFVGGQGAGWVPALR